MPDRRDHRHQEFRPDEGEYAAAKAQMGARDRTMNDYLRACLRWLDKDPGGALATLAPL